MLTIADKWFILKTIEVEIGRAYRNASWVQRVRTPGTAQDFLEFHLKIRFRVDGRNLRWELIAPNGEVLEESKGASNISAGFDRGTV